MDQDRGEASSLAFDEQGQEAFLDRTNYWGQTARADAQGRILIPALLRESAGMQGEVAVMGHEEYLEVWSHGAPPRADGPAVLR